MSRNNNNNNNNEYITDDSHHLPSWMDETNDSKHLEETEPLLFGTGHLMLQEEHVVAAVDESHDTDTMADHEDPKQEEEEEHEKEDDGADEETGLVSPPPSSSNPPVATNNNNKKKKPTTYGATTTTKNTTPTTNKQPLARNKQAPAHLASRPHMPRQNPCLWLFHLLSGTAVVANLLILVTQILPLALPTTAKTSEWSIYTVMNTVLKLYMSLFCLLLILVELDVTSVLRNFALLQSWCSRGFLYSFLGLISTVEAYSDRAQSVMHGAVTDGISWTSIFLTVSAWLECAIGVLYMLLAVCCLQRVQTSLKQNETEKWRLYRADMRAWRQRQRVLEQD